MSERASFWLSDGREQTSETGRAAIPDKIHYGTRAD